MSLFKKDGKDVKIWKVYNMVDGKPLSWIDKNSGCIVDLRPGENEVEDALSKYREKVSELDSLIAGLENDLESGKKTSKMFQDLSESQNIRIKALESDNGRLVAMVNEYEASLDRTRKQLNSIEGKWWNALDKIRTMKEAMPEQVVEETTKQENDISLEKGKVIDRMERLPIYENVSKGIVEKFGGGEWHMYKELMPFLERYFPKYSKNYVMNLRKIYLMFLEKRYNVELESFKDQDAKPSLYMKRFRIQHKKVVVNDDRETYTIGKMCRIPMVR